MVPTKRWHVRLFKYQINRFLRVANLVVCDFRAVVVVVVGGSWSSSCRRGCLRGRAGGTCLKRGIKSEMSLSSRSESAWIERKRKGRETVSSSTGRINQCRRIAPRSRCCPPFLSTVLLLVRIIANVYILSANPGRYRQPRMIENERIITRHTMMRNIFFSNFGNLIFSSRWKFD